MNRYITARHFVNGEATLSDLEEGLGKLEEALEITREEELDFNWGLKLTLDKKILG